MKRLFLLLVLALPLLVTAQDLRESVCVVRGEYTDAEKAILGDFSLWFSRAHFIYESRTLAVYQKGTFGSGTVIEYEGQRYVLTNRHVVGYAGEVSLEFHLRTGLLKYAHCPVATVSHEYDLALILLPDSCRQPALALLSGELDEGQDIVAAGYPGLDNKPSWQLSKGAISNAALFIDNQVHPLVQHTASIDPGSSGGPLLMKQGDVYVITGVNTLKASYRDNVGLAISAADIRTFLQDVDSPRLADYDLLHHLSVDGKQWADMVNDLSVECFDSLRSMTSEMPLDVVANTLRFECDAKALKAARRAKLAAEGIVSNPMDAESRTISSLRLEYTNYFSLNQRAELAYELTFCKYVFLGGGIGCKTDRYLQMGADSVFSPATNVGLPLSVRAGIRVPVQVTDKYLIVPRILVAPNLDVMDKVGYNRLGQTITLPLLVGADFVIPAGDYSVNVGLHYICEMTSFRDSAHLLTRDNSRVPRRKLASLRGGALYGQNGLTLSVAVCL